MNSETWVALVSLIVSGFLSFFALFVTTKERRSPLRQSLYTKQLDIYFEIVRLIIEIKSLITDALEDYQDYLDHELYKSESRVDTYYLIEDEATIEPEYQSKIDRVEVISKAKGLYTELNTKMEIWINFLPERISRDILKFTKYIHDHGIDPDPDNFYPDESISFLEAQTKNITAGIRQHLGVDELSSEILNLIKFRYSTKKKRNKK
jgi:hypothetical protein